MTRLPAGHPWVVQVTELNAALGRAARLAAGGNPVIVRPRRDMPIGEVSHYVGRCDEPPGTIVRVLSDLGPTTAENMGRQFAHRARRRAEGAPSVPSVIIVTHEPAAELKRVLGVPVRFVETTEVRERPAIGDAER